MSRESLKASILDQLRVASVRPLTVSGVSMYVRGLTGAQRMQLQEAAAAGETLADYKVAALGLCDEAGERLFASGDDIAELDGESLAQIAKAVIEASGLGQASMEDAAKN